MTITYEPPSRIIRSTNCIRQLANMRDASQAWQIACQRVTRLFAGCYPWPPHLMPYAAQQTGKTVQPTWHYGSTSVGTRVYWSILRRWGAIFILLLEIIQMQMTDGSYSPRQAPTSFSRFVRHGSRLFLQGFSCLYTFWYRLIRTGLWKYHGRLLTSKSGQSSDTYLCLCPDRFLF